MRQTRWLSLSAVVTIALAAHRAHATDPYEIQVYDGTANAAGVIGLELHTNYVAKGLTAASPPELPLNHQAHATLEPSYGLTDWWELGGYLQSTLRPDGVFDYAGFKLRSKFVTPPSFHPRWRFGANFELSDLPSKYDRDGWGTELRPIAAWEDERFLFAVNPIVDLSLAGDGLHAGPSLQPAAKASFKWDGQLGVGFEYYGNLGPIADGFSPLAAQEHYVFEAIDLLTIDALELNAGVGEGLTAASNALVFKVIVGYEFDGPGVKRRGATSALSRHPMRGTRLF